VGGGRTAHFNLEVYPNLSGEVIVIESHRNSLSRICLWGLTVQLLVGAARLLVEDVQLILGAVPGICLSATSEY
jgi:hypothetical protein